MTNPTEIWRFQTHAVGRDVCVFDSLPSTNDVAAEADVPAGAVIVARHQTHGRGQHGRVWQSRSNASLLASVRLNPPPELNRPVILTAWAAVAVGDAILDLTGCQSRIKWPNDLLVQGKKVCGILIEQRRATIIGIGLNLNQSAAEFTEANLPDATSLGILAARPFDLRDVCEAVVRKLDAEYARLASGERSPLEAAWKRHIGIAGRHVVVESADGELIAGRLMEASFDGIEIDLGEGAVRVLTPEFVRHISSS